MRKVLLLASLCMALAFVLSAPAMAQSASAAPVPGSPECPEVRETPDGLQCSSGPDIPYPSSASPEASPTASASPPGREGDPCGSFAIGTPEADECYRSFGLEPLEPGDASPTASPTASATASASASASVTALPETGGPASGGPVSALALGSLALLVVSGLMALGPVRRS